MEKKKHPAEEKTEESAKNEKEGAKAEVAIEEPATESAPEKSEAEKALEKALADAEDMKRKWYSVTAEYENYRKRTARESARRYAEGRADVVVKLLPIADNLERAYAACRDEATKKGVSMVLDAFAKLLEGEKIAVIDPLGQPFDAEKHEAIMAVDPAEGEKSGTVREVYLKGYEQDGKVLRFAQVIVVK